MANPSMHNVTDSEDDDNDVIIAVLTKRNVSI